ncbi:MAG: FG-GAP repeat protein, partial [Thermoleophilia bacterium]|nr:FG-GAP repeat protein [Thermoleophilia bacterium]
MSMLAAATSAVAATSFERPPLSIDRSDVSLSDGEWDELQEALRQTRRHSPASFAGAAKELGRAAPAADDNCGGTVAVGDVNGDGRADIALGCVGDDTGASGAGSVVVLTRNAANSGFNAGIELGHPAPAAGDGCGGSVAVGDVNGDGRADIAMGCDSDNAPSNSGSVIVLTRNVANTGFNAGSLLVHPDAFANDFCGTSVAVGDVNGDGRADIAMGCTGRDLGVGDEGIVVVFTRDAANTGFDAGIEVGHPTPGTGDACGSSVAMGDVNGDGHADIVTGCQTRNAGAAGSGSVVVLTRNATNTDFDAGIELSHPTPAANDSCGASVAMGDVNGDGRADIAMGCTNDDTGAADAGSVVVLARNAANTGFDPGIELGHPTPSASDYCGRSVAVGDVNGDGRADIAMGCPSDDTGGADAGSVVVLDGAGSAQELANPTPAADDQCGYSVTAGDVNGDGRSDLVMGCHGDSTGASAAGNMIVLARNAANTGYDSVIELANPTPVAGDTCGDSVAVGDVNGDGRDD